MSDRMSHLLTVVLIFVVAVGAVRVPVTSSAASRAAAPPAAASVCLEAGQIVCSECCREVLVCLDTSSPPAVVQVCDQSTICSATDGQCVDIGAVACSSCRLTAIECHAVGVFPDPYDCAVYHICVDESGESIRKDCESGWAYEPATKACSKELTDGVYCDSPIRCNVLGEANIVSGDANIYYICMSDEIGMLIPQFFRCPHGGTFDTDTYSCHL